MERVCALVRRSDPDGCPGLSIRFRLASLRSCGVVVLPIKSSPCTVNYEHILMLFYYCKYTCSRGVNAVALPRGSSAKGKRRRPLVLKKLPLCCTTNSDPPPVLSICATIFQAEPSLVRCCDPLLIGDRPSCHTGWSAAWRVWCSWWSGTLSF